MTPDEKALRGLVLLEEAIIDMLVEGMKNDVRVGPKAINERVGLPEGGDKGGGHQNWFAMHFLNKLMADGRIERVGHGRYEPTKQELANRRNKGAGALPNHVWDLDLEGRKRRRRR